MDEDWELLLSFFPPGWEALAAETGALKGLRRDKSPENLLRVLLLHLGCGHSLRETAVRARRSGLADLSPVALKKRLAKSGPWLLSLCQALFEGPSPDRAGLEVRAVDATTVKEPGKTGSLWRVHYSMRLPSLVCDHFVVTGTEGVGTGESFRRFPVAAGDHLIGDRGYSTASGIAHVAASGGRVMVRVNTGSLRFVLADGRRFDLRNAVSALDRPGSVASWDVATASVDGRVCAIRKSDAAIGIALEKLRRKAAKNGRTPKPQSLEFAKYVIVFTTFPESGFAPETVLDWYRLRWQVELAFKRFKSVAQLGHLPKRGGESSKAWLYGKLFTALLTERLIAHASAFSPWGYDLQAPRSHPEPVA